MRRRAAVLIVLPLALLAFVPPAAGATDIPGTPLTVFDLGPLSKAVYLGGTTNFSFAVFNGGPPPYVVNVTVNVSDPSFQVTVSPSMFTLPRDEVREIHVNVTAPEDGGTRIAAIIVRFEALSPVPGFTERNLTLTAQATPASVDALTAFLAVAGIIVIGFTATLIFERTRVPDLLILILLGLLLGPVTLTYFGISFVQPGVLQLATPYFTSLALMFILFDGGLNLRLLEVVRKLGVVGIHTGLNFILAVFGIAFATSILLGYDWVVALLLGAILGGTSSAVVIGIVRALHVSDETKIVLTLESVITDVLCVVTVLALMELLKSGPGGSMTIVFQDLAQAFAVSLVFAIAAGIAWLFLLQKVEKRPFSYMLTIAVLFGLFALSELSGGSGAMSAFVFGLVLGNHVDFAKRLRIRARFVIDARIKQFHSELAFVIRTFFFVFLGVVFTFDFGGGWRVSTSLPFLAGLNGTFALFLLGVFAIFLVIVFARVLTARIFTLVRPKPPAERRILWSLMGRGLAAAVLASLPFTVPAFVDPSGSGELYYQTVLAPYETQFTNIAFFIILLTVVATTVGVVVSERALGRATRATPQIPEWRGLEAVRQMDLDDLEISDRPPIQGR